MTLFRIEFGCWGLHLDDTTGAVWRHLMFFFTFEDVVSSYFN